MALCHKKAGHPLCREEIGRGLFECTVPALHWVDGGEQRNAAVTIGFRAGHHPSKRQMCYVLASLLGVSIHDNVPV